MDHRVALTIRAADTVVAVEDQETEVVAEVVVAEVVAEHSSNQAAADLYFFPHSSFMGFHITCWGVRFWWVIPVFADETHSCICSLAEHFQGGGSGAVDIQPQLTCLFV